MQQFEITLQNEKIKSYRSIAFIILLLNLSVFIFLLFYDQYRYEAASAILLVGIYIFMRLYFIRKYNQGNYLDQVMLFVLAGCWLGLQNYFMITAMVILGVLYHFALQKLQLIFTTEKIVKLNFPVKEFEWNTLNNVILKDNRLIQAEIERSQNINEHQFNSFAKSQLS
jgi:glucose uptake protein GlcU